MKSKGMGVLLFWVSFFALLGMAGDAPGQTIVNHDCTRLAMVPESAIDAAKADLHIAYNHTSHGSQIISGLNALKEFPAFGSTYAWSEDGLSGLELRDHGIPCHVPDLSQTDDEDEYGVLPWVTCTREFLDNPDNSHINVVMWSWCSINGHDAQKYVDNMEYLVAEYPSVEFVFMTGHAECEGETTGEYSIHFNNQLIRQHCLENNRVLFDFADIEAHDPDGSYFWDQDMCDNLDYDGGGNWAVEWLAANPGSELDQLTTGEGVEDYDGCWYCEHSDSPAEATINCVLKGHAAWWLFAELAGWSSDVIFECGFEGGDASRWSAIQ